VLSDRLGGLVDDGILERRPDPHHAGRHVYELTAQGRDLWPALHALLVWGRRHRAASGRVYKHAPCGTPLDDGGRCGTCGLTPGPEDVLTELRGRRRSVRNDPVAAALRAPHRLLDPIDP
jgi:DNA-binding MarR family transcriptional regulator